LAADIYTQLIRPIADYPIVAVDLPVADRGYSANSAKTIYDLVEYLDPVEDKKSRREIGDIDGSKTVTQLRKVKASTSRVFGAQHSGSLALHPGVYCYGASGQFVPKAFIGAVGFVADLERRDKFFEFTAHRARFEEFILAHRYFISQIGTSQGSGGKRGIPAVITLYRAILENLKAGVTKDSEICQSIEKHEALDFLYEPSDKESDAGTRFRKEDRKAVLLRESLTTELICPICKARLYRKDRSLDHRERLANGGASTQANMQLTHPYCNTGYKEALLAGTGKS
jgi:hypothetical protein